MSGFFDSLSEQKGYEEYKYVMQDQSSYGFGARLSYSECMGNNDVPFKFRAIVEHYILKDNISPDTTIESHLYYLSPESFAARTYVELKGRVRVWMKVSEKSFFGKRERIVNREKVISITELMKMDTDTKKAADLKIGELIVSKLALMSFSV